MSSGEYPGSFDKFSETLDITDKKLQVDAYTRALIEYRQNIGVTTERIPTPIVDLGAEAIKRAVYQEGVEAA